ncbi:MAG: RNase adapter RapZ [Acidobacteriota bacterium]
MAKSEQSPNEVLSEAASRDGKRRKELVIVTGISGAGKGSALRTFEDLGYHAVDNLPLELLGEFAQIVERSAEIQNAVIVADIREGQTLDRLPEILKNVKNVLPTKVVFLDAQDAVLVRRYSETRRPHPLRKSETVSRSIVEERQLLDPIRNLADIMIDTSNFNVHELRAHIQARFGQEGQAHHLLVSCLSFGFKNGVPLDADLVFDVRFLPNPHFVPEFRDKTGKDPEVARFVCGFPQTEEFLDRVTGLLEYLLPHYVTEGKSYLTIGFGCTGGQHRSVLMVEEMARRLRRAGYQVKRVHRDIPR